MKKHFSVLGLYYMIMAIGLSFCYAFLNVKYDSPEFSRAFLPFMITLALLSGTYGIWKNDVLTLQILNKPGYFWFMIVMIPLLGLGIITLIETFEVSSKFFILIFDVLLIGFAEETMFRKILLGGSLREVSPVKAIILSSSFFSLLHVLNIFGGVSFQDIVSQLVSTLVMGIYLGCIYVYTKFIWFPILFHSTWDYIILSGFLDKYEFATSLVLVITVAEIVISIILIAKFKKLNNPNRGFS